MRPFVSRFTFLLGLVLVLTGVALNMDEKTTLAIILIIAGLIITFISTSFLVRKKKEDDEVYPEPDPEDFADNKPGTSTVEEQAKK